MSAAGGAVEQAGPWGQDHRMEFEQMQQRARAVRSRYAAVEASAYGRSWTTEEIMLGFFERREPIHTDIASKSKVRAQESRMSLSIPHLSALGRGRRRSRRVRGRP